MLSLGGTGIGFREAVLSKHLSGLVETLDLAGAPLGYFLSTG